MNAYLAEVVKKREKAVELRKSRDFAVNLLNEGLGTLEQIARLTGLALAEVKRLAYARE